MSLFFAIDELYRAGWNPVSHVPCERAADGRPYPTSEEVVREFARAGSELAFSEDAEMGVFVAAWGACEAIGDGQVAGSSRDEAAVFALARLLGSARMVG